MKIHDVKVRLSAITKRICVEFAPHTPTRLHENAHRVHETPDDARILSYTLYALEYSRTHRTRACTAR
jgi:hypothetical protein